MNVLSKLGCATLLFWIVFSLLALAGWAQHVARPKHVLVLYWDDQDHPANVDFSRNLRAALQSAAPGGFEYYSEYLESNRFPDKRQSELLRDYILQKYTGRTINVAVATTSAALDFLLKYRSELFPNAPIVFAATYQPDPPQLSSGAGATGVIFVNLR